MTLVPSLDASAITSRRATDNATISEALIAVSKCSFEHSDDVDGSSLSVAGEEDPGAALDVIGSSADGPEAQWCPWPREASA
jgi:hypothetical protein